MKDRKCTYKWSIEDQGNRKEIICTGIIRSEMMSKTTKTEKEITIVWIEDDATGEMREVAMYAVSFPKGGNNA